MYCSNCGSQATGNFCSACGQALEGTSPVQAEVVPIDWSSEIRYERLISAPEVRDRIAAAGRQHRKQMSGEEFLATFDKLVPMGVSMEKLAQIAQPLYARLGLKTGKTAQVQLQLPAGRVLVGVLCAMAAQGNELQHVDQLADGCAVHATIPSSVWSFAGELMVSVRRTDAGTLVEAAAKIPGQAYDWGKSQRLLDKLFESVPAFAA